MNHLIMAFSLLLVLFATPFSQASSLGGTEGRVFLLQDSFVSPDYKMTEQKDFNYLGAEVRTYPHKEFEDHLTADVAGLYAPGRSPLNYLNVAELAYTVGNGSTSSASVGRKKEEWSLLEDQWNLGLFQPLFKWNPIQPSEQGLTGLFVSYSEQNQWGFTLFGSGLFIPDQGPGYEIRDGHFQDANPYFTRPPQYAILQGKKVPVNYEVQKPEVTDVVMNKSFGAKAFVGNPEKGFYAQASAANKPSNQMALAFRGYFELVSKTGEGKVTAKPFYHTVNSADIRYSLDNFWMSYGAIQDRPQQPEFSPEWTYVAFSDSLLHGPTLGFKTTRWSVAGSYLNVSEGPERAFGEDASEASKFSPHRYPFGSAYQVEFKTEYRLKRSEKIIGSTKYVHGMEDEFQLWLANLKYQLNSQWLIGGQLQAVSTTNSAKAQRSVFYEFENNDSVGVGLTYVF